MNSVLSAEIWDENLSWFLATSKPDVLWAKTWSFQAHLCQALPLYWCGPAGRRLYLISSFLDFYPKGRQGPKLKHKRPVWATFKFRLRTSQIFSTSLCPKRIIWFCGLIILPLVIFSRLLLLDWPGTSYRYSKWGIPNSGAECQISITKLKFPTAIDCWFTIEEGWGYLTQRGKL